MQILDPTFPHGQIERTVLYFIFFLLTFPLHDCFVAFQFVANIFSVGEGGGTLLPFGYSLKFIFFFLIMIRDKPAKGLIFSLVHLVYTERLV